MPERRFEITPATVLAGDAVQIVLRGFSKNAMIRVIAERPTKSPTDKTKSLLSRSEATFRTDSLGQIDFSTANPISGTYEEADVRGLSWSMRSSTDPAPDNWPRERIRFTAFQNGRKVARGDLSLLNGAAPVVTERADGDGMRGATLSKLHGTDRRPTVIVLGGSEGGDRLARIVAPRLASRGYAVLSLPYYAPSYLGRSDLRGLPQAFVDIPLERLQEGYDWLVARPNVDVERIGVYGVSKGAELALLAATKFDWIKAVVAIAPSDVVWEGWGKPNQQPGTRSSFSWRSRALPFVPYGNTARDLGAGAIVNWRRIHDCGRDENPKQAIAARIPVETFRGRLLVAGGMKDQVWGSGPMAQNIIQSRAHAGLKTTGLAFADAGHSLSGHGWNPTTQLASAEGGSACGIARAQAQTWSTTLDFLADALSCRPSKDPTKDVF
jgi:hypothetical protein